MKYIGYDDFLLLVDYIGGFGVDVVFDESVRMSRDGLHEAISALGYILCVVLPIAQLDFGRQTFVVPKLGEADIFVVEDEVPWAIERLPAKLVTFKVWTWIHFSFFFFCHGHLRLY